MRTMALRGCIRRFWKSHTLWLSMLIPILAAPLPLLGQTSVAKCGFCVIVIGIYWVTEVIPLSVTSLLPVVLFPVFGVMTTKAVCQAYVQDTLMLFLGSLIVAVAVEKWNLHKRLALRTLTLVGPEAKWLLLGVMLPTWFLSMWMSNTATTAMMMPIVAAILQQIKECQLQDNQEEMMIDYSSNPTVEVEGMENRNMESHGTTKVEMKEESVIANRAEKEKKFLGFAKTFSLAVAFSSNIGGMATLTGTPPNVIFKGLADGLYLKYGAKNPVDFANWLIVGIPMAVVLFIFLWVWMQLYSEGLGCLQFWRKDTTSYDKVRTSLKEEYKNMGPMTFPEIVVLLNFVLLAILWVTRKPGFVQGWGDLFYPGYVGDSTPAIAISILLFILPARSPAQMWRSQAQTADISGTSDPDPAYEPLLDWATVNRKMAWGVLLLMGGGFAMAEACEISGLSSWVSDNLEGLASLPVWATALLLSLIVTAITQVTSNAATTTLFVPIVGDLLYPDHAAPNDVFHSFILVTLHQMTRLPVAQLLSARQSRFDSAAQVAVKVTTGIDRRHAFKMGINPLYFMIPCTIASSLAFLLPVATPPNAIVFAAGYLRVKDMVLAGLPVNIFAIFILNLGVNSWVATLYDLTNMPHDMFNATGNRVQLMNVSIHLNGNHSVVNVTAF